MKTKISIGVPYYGSFSGEWTSQMMQFIASLAPECEIREIITCGSMTADHNRNLITADFLKSDAEWLFWIDSDTLVPVGTIQRLLATGRTLASGLYYGKNPPNTPIAYHLYNGAFTPINQTIIWEKGELIPVDATGMGCMLVHRSVFEDILKSYEVFQYPGGGIVTIFKNDILGDVETTEGVRHHEHDGKVYKGQFRQRLRKPTLKDLKFPFFMIEHIRTEDMYFFDLAKKVGHTPVLDSSVECGHLRYVPFTGEDFRSIYGH